MKRAFSILFSLIIAICCIGLTTVSAVAAPYVGSVETTSKQFNADVTVNGKPSVDGKYEIVETNQDVEYTVKVEFNYTGSEPLQYWEIPGLTEGTDYVIISDDGNTLVIGIINDDITYVKANAVTALDEDDSTTVPATTNNDKKSPSTGVGTASAVAVASMAGAVSLLAAKRKSK